MALIFNIAAKTFQTIGLDLFFALCVDWLFCENFIIFRKDNIFPYIRCVFGILIVGEDIILPKNNEILFHQRRATKTT